jgi:hypothetical protein
VKFRRERMHRFSRCTRDPVHGLVAVISSDIHLGSIPRRNASTPTHDIEIMTKMVRSLGGSPVVMCVFSFSLDCNSPSLSKGAACVASPDVTRSIARACLLMDTGVDIVDDHPPST